MKLRLSHILMTAGLLTLLGLVLWATSGGARVSAASDLPAQTIFTTQTPTEPDTTDGKAYELGTKFKPLADGRISAIRYWKAPSEKAIPCDACSYTHTGHIWSNDGQVLAIAHFYNESASGWQQASIGESLAVRLNVTYVVSVDVDSFFASTTGGLQNAVTNGNLSTIADGNNGVYGVPGAFPTQSYQNTNYFRDVVFDKIITINSGGNAVRSFDADNFVGNIEGDYKGQTNSTTNHVEISGVLDAAPEAVYQTERLGDDNGLIYTIAGLDADGTNTISPNGGYYRVRLHFAETTFTEPGQRQFNVSINDQQVLNNFDIVKEAGGPNKAIVKQFDVLSGTLRGVGAITISLHKGAAGQPKINGIEVFRVQRQA